VSASCWNLLSQVVRGVGVEDVDRRRGILPHGRQQAEPQDVVNRDRPARLGPHEGEEAAVDDAPGQEVRVRPLSLRALDPHSANVQRLPCRAISECTSFRSAGTRCTSSTTTHVPRGTASTSRRNAEGSGEEAQVDVAVEQVVPPRLGSTLAQPR